MSSFERGKKIKIGLPVRPSVFPRRLSLVEEEEQGGRPAAVARGEKERCSRRHRRRRRLRPRIL